MLHRCLRTSLANQGHTFKEHVSELLTCPLDQKARPPFGVGLSQNNYLQSAGKAYDKSAAKYDV